MFLYDLPTIPGYALDVGDGVLTDPLPYLDESIWELRTVCGVDGVRHDVVSWIQVWRMGGPVRSINAFILQELLTHSGPLGGTQGQRHQHMGHKVV